MSIKNLGKETLLLPTGEGRLLGLMEHKAGDLSMEHKGLTRAAKSREQCQERLSHGGGRPSCPREPCCQHSA